MEIDITPKRQHAYTILVLVMIIVVLILRIELRKEREEEADKSREAKTTETSSEAKPITIKAFDPNTVTLAELLSMGLTRSEALSLIRYRESGKVFHFREEVIACYGFSDSLYFALEPYITIGEEYRYKPREPKSYDRVIKSESPKRLLLAPSKFLIDTVSTRYLVAIGALTQRQAEVFVRWRDMSGINNMEELRGCYTVSDSVATALEKWVIFPTKEVVAQPTPLVDLNRADSATLRSVIGIGEKTVVAILDYREKLGGFYSVEQLCEIDCITESNFEKIITQIFADSCDISKIDINFALANKLSSNPYIAPRLRKLLKVRQIKGGWSSTRELVEDKIFTEEEAQRVRPYLHFEVQGEFHDTQQ